MSMILPRSTIDRMKDQVYWSFNETMKHFVIAALEAEMDRREQEPRVLQDPATKEMVDLKPGDPYPPRAGKIRTGRPVKI